MGPKLVLNLESSNFGDAIRAGNLDLGRQHHKSFWRNWQIHYLQQKCSHLIRAGQMIRSMQMRVFIFCSFSSSNFVGFETIVFKSSWSNYKWIYCHYNISIGPFCKYVEFQMNSVFEQNILWTVDSSATSKKVYSIDAPGGTGVEDQLAKMPLLPSQGQHQF